MKVREICFGASYSKRSSVDGVAVDAYTVMLSLKSMFVTQDNVLFDWFDDSTIRRFEISQAKFRN